MRFFKKTIPAALALALTLLAACSAPEAQIPAESTPTSEAARIYPDYRDITIPPNIAPLNIQVKSAGEAFDVCHLPATFVATAVD